MRSRVSLLLLVGILLGLIFSASSAFAMIALQLPFDVGTTWGPRTYDNHNCWGSYDGRQNAVDWFYTLTTQSDCPYWTSNYSVSKGMNLRAMHAGTIYIVQLNGSGYGNYVVIKSTEDPTYFTLYAHMDTFRTGLAVGQSVAPGDIIGTVGWSGSGSGGFAHLHLEIMHGTSSSDWVPQDIHNLYVDGQTVDFNNYACIFNGWISGYWGKPLVSAGTLQGSSGTISGWVKDTSNAAISGATVTTNTGATTTTDASGNYTIAYAVAGTYYVTASKTGYNPVVNTGVVVTSGNTTTSNFNLPTTNTSNDAGIGTDAGNTFATASAISTGAFTGYGSASTDTNDYYKFSVTSGQYITCTVSPQAGTDCDIYLYDPAGTLRASATGSGSITETVAYTAASTGNWVMRINTYAGSGLYSFNNATFNTTAPAGSNLALSGTATTDSYYDASFTGAKAIDGVNTSASKWMSLATIDPNWLAVDLGSSQSINGFVVKMPGQAGESYTYNAKTFKIQSGLSPIGPWTDECSVDNNAQANIITRNYITGKSLRYVRLQVIISGIDTTTRIPEFEIWGGSCTNPTITTQPVSQTKNVGESVTFSVTATGATSYQWKKGGVNISGATTSSYTIASVVTGDAGSFTAAVTNSCGTVTSNAATLTVNCAVPSITTQPVSQVITAGQGVTFTVAATGATSYQWKKGGTNISGATATSYTIASVVTGDAGNFTCAVTNSCGTVTSSTAVLSVTVMSSGTPTGTNRATVGTATTDSNYDSTYTGAKAIDGINTSASKWVTTSVAPPHWLAIDLGQNRTVNGFVLKMPGQAGEQSYYNAKNFQIQWATSLAGPWYDECVVDNTAQANTVSRVYSIAKTMRYVRLYITNAGIDNYSRINEFEVWCQ